MLSFVCGWGLTRVHAFGSGLSLLCVFGELRGRACARNVRAIERRLGRLGERDRGERTCAPQAETRRTVGQIRRAEDDGFSHDKCCGAERHQAPYAGMVRRRRGGGSAIETPVQHLQMLSGDLSLPSSNVEPRCHHLLANTGDELGQSGRRIGLVTFVAVRECAFHIRRRYTTPLPRRPPGGAARFVAGTQGSADRQRSAGRRAP
jgi:hypothetical protein